MGTNGGYGDYSGAPRIGKPRHIAFETDSSEPLPVITLPIRLLHIKPEVRFIVDPNNNKDKIQKCNIAKNIKTDQL